MDNYRTNDLQGREHFNNDFPTQFYTAGTTDQYAVYDMGLSAKCNLQITYIVEIKDYTNNGYYRPYSKFTYNGEDRGYQIDANKLRAVCAEAAATNSKPILYCRFGDLTIVWDLAKVDFESRTKMVKTNKDGQHYGEEDEYTEQTYLYKDEAVWTKKTNI